ncbi:MAG TPA: tetratricopeptide repeat protein [Pyrinomonadaceae bacterium]|nr:tetratricopeptide repeat protein [Pyrinomonadaceae bacterium]
MSLPFRDYADAVMRTAQYSVLPESGGYIGVVPGFHGVYARGGDEAACAKRLREVLEEWIAFRASRNLEMPSVGGLNLTREEVEGYVLLKSKLESLEREVEALRGELGIPSSGSRHTRLGAFSKWYSSHFTLISSALGLVALLLAYFVYNVDPFESYREASEKKTSGDIVKNTAEYYRAFGDMMMDGMDEPAAEQAYKKALEVNASNSKARGGLLLSQFLRSDSDFATQGGAALLPAKIKLLEDSFELKEDRRLLRLQALLYRNAGQEQRALDIFRDCTRLHPKHFPCQLELGFTYMHEKVFNLKEAIAAFRKAVELEPGRGLAQYNLGYSYLLNLELDNAIEHLKESAKLRDHFGTFIGLGNAYLYKGDIREAHRYYEKALSKFGQPGFDKTGFIPAYARYHFMPVRQGDQTSVNNSRAFYAPDDFKALAHYSMSFACAREGKFDEANSHFTEAGKLDKDGGYRELILNRIVSLRQFSDKPQTDEATRARIERWFDDRERELSAPRHPAAGAADARPARTEAGPSRV